MTILKKLKKELKKAGLSEGLADVLNITKEDEIEGAITLLKSTQKSNENELDYSEVLSSEEFKKFVTDNGLEGVLKHSKTLQGLTDQKVNKGIKTATEKIMKELDPDYKGDDTPPKGDDKEVPEWFKPFASQMQESQKNKERSAKLEKAKEALKDSDIPEELHEKVLGRYNLDSETSIEDQTERIKTEVQEFQQFFIGDASGKGLPSGGGFTETEKLKKIEEVGKEFVEKHKKN